MLFLTMLVTEKLAKVFGGSPMKPLKVSAVLIRFAFVLIACGIAQIQAVGQLKLALAPTPATSAETLETEQKSLAERFAKLEELFLRMSELEASSNPTRSSLLQQAAQLSKQLATLQRLNSAAELLAKGQLSRALQEQESTRENLQKLLELLQSENRQSRIREDRARIEALIKDIQRLEKVQRSLRGRTESGQDKDSAGRDQKDIERQTAETDQGLADALGQEAAAKDQPSEQKTIKKSPPLILKIQLSPLIPNLNRIRNRRIKLATRVSQNKTLLTHQKRLRQKIQKTTSHLSQTVRRKKMESRKKERVSLRRTSNLLLQKMLPRAKTQKSLPTKVLQKVPIRLRRVIVSPVSHPKNLHHRRKIRRVNV